MPPKWVEWRPRSTGAGADPVALVPSPSGGIEGTSLLRYVLSARVGLLAERTVGDANRWAPATNATYTREAMARYLGMSKATLTGRLGPKAQPNLQQVVELEHQLTAFAHEVRGMSATTVRGLGWLAAFAAEVLPGERIGGNSTSLGRWLSDLASPGPANSAEAIVLGEALLGLLSGAPPRRAVAAIWEQNREAAELAAWSLVAVATRPPGGGATAATQIGAQLGTRILPIVETHLTKSPVGFRAMRLVGRVFQLAHSDAPPRWWSTGCVEEVAEARALLRRMNLPAGQLPDPYPGRSLFLEAVQASLLVPGDDEWRREAVSMIAERTFDPARPRRERSYAAFCLWRHGELSTEDIRRSWIGADSDHDYAQTLTAILDASPDGGPTALLLDGLRLRSIDDRGIQMVADATTYERAVKRPERPPMGHRLDAIERLPLAVGAATAQLVRIALLSPDGTTRGRACEALREALVSEEVIEIITAVVHQEGCPEWLQEICAFVLGQIGDPTAAPLLIELAADRNCSPVVRHAAFWALGDLRIDADIEPAIVAAEAVITQVPRDRDVLRAAAYCLAVVERGTSRTQLLQLMSNPYLIGIEDRAHSDQPAKFDPVAAALARWGLNNSETIRRRDAVGAARRIWGARADDLTPFVRATDESPPGLAG